MRKFIQSALLGGSLLLSTSVLAEGEDKILNIYNWSDYITPEAIKTFEQRTGIKVHYDVYDSQEMAEAKMLSGSSGYDLVVASGAFLQRQIESGVYQELDKSRLKNYANLDKKLLSLVSVYDKDNQHAIPYMWGTTGLGYNVDQVKAILGDVPMNSWSLVFEPENIKRFSDCGVALVDAPTEVSAAILKYLGKDPNSEKPSDLKLVEDKLMAIRPYIKYFDSSRYISDLADGEICVAVGWSGDVFTAQQRALEANNSVNVNYVIPTEGAQVWSDTFNITADAAHEGAAYQFLDYLMEPEVIAGISNYIWYANANKAATKLINPDITSHPGIYPDKETYSKLLADKQRSHKYTRLLTRMWTRVKTTN